MDSSLKSNELQVILEKNLGQNKARMRLLSYLILGMLKVHTVNFKQLALAYHNGAKLPSRLRRVHRFFAQFTFEELSYCKLIASMIPVKEPTWGLSLDRTNWKLGSLNINLLFLCILYEGVGIPIFWCVLGNKRGNSSQKERIDLLQGFIRCFGREKIAYLVADREFIGVEWIDFLVENEIRFYSRIRKNMHLMLPRAKEVKAFWLLDRQPINQPYFYPKPVCIQGTWVYFSGVRYINQQGKVDYLMLIAFNKNELSLDLYKKRWQIETMFKAFKSAGFNLEVTHVQNYKRLNTLLTVLVLAYIWAYQVGVFLHQEIKPIRIKKHGRKAVSLFTYGLDFLTETFVNRFRKQEVIAYQLFLSGT